MLVSCKRIRTSEMYEVDQGIAEHIQKYTEKLNEDLKILCGETEVELEARFKYIRTQETNLSNFMADILRTEYDVDFTLMNSGTYRSNAVIEKGLLT